MSCFHRSRLNRHLSSVTTSSLLHQTLLSLEQNGRITLDTAVGYAQHGYRKRLLRCVLCAGLTGTSRSERLRHPAVGRQHALLYAARVESAITGTSQMRYLLRLACIHLCEELF